MTTTTETGAAADPVPTAAGAGPAAAALADLRAEIDTLDDAMHDLVMRRAAVVARLAGSRAKGGAPALRPGREAQVLRRLLARHDGPLPAAAVVRLWRDLFAASTALQGGFSVAADASAGPGAERLAREHFGPLTPVLAVPGAARTLAAVAAGEASAAVLPLPREEGDGPAAEAAWWTGLDASRLRVAARLPFWALAGEASTAEALLLTPGPPDPSGADRSLLRIEAAAGTDRAEIAAALSAVGLAPRHLLLRRGSGGTLALAEVEGAVGSGDPRLEGLAVGCALPLGLYAVPMRGES
jgi:chorismate mutase